MSKKQFSLPKTFTDEWIKALRSGEYTQCPEQLMHTEGGDKSYCCLGVACDVAGHGEILNIYGDSSYPRVVKHGNGVNRFKNLPKELIKDNDLVDKLAELNDSEGQNFNQIADWIDENVKVY